MVPSSIRWTPAINRFYHQRWGCFFGLCGDRLKRRKRGAFRRTQDLNVSLMAISFKGQAPICCILAHETYETWSQLVAGWKTCSGCVVPFCHKILRQPLAIFCGGWELQPGTAGLWWSFSAPACFLVMISFSEQHWFWEGLLIIGPHFPEFARNISGRTQAPVPTTLDARGFPKVFASWLDVLETGLRSKLTSRSSWQKRQALQRRSGGW